MLEQVIFWGQLPAYVAVATVVGLFFKGVIVSRSQLDQVQKTADLFFHAWEASQLANQKQAELLGDLTAGLQTVQHLIESWPNPNPSRDEAGDLR